MKKGRAPNLGRFELTGEERVIGPLLHDAWWRERVTREFASIAPGAGDMPGAAGARPRSARGETSITIDDQGAAGAAHRTNGSRLRPASREVSNHEGVVLFEPGRGKRRPIASSVPPGPIPGFARRFEHLDSNGGVVLRLGKKAAFAAQPPRSTRGATCGDTRGATPGPGGEKAAPEAKAKTEPPPIRGRSRRYVMDHAGNMMQLLETKVPLSARLRPGKFMACPCPHPPGGATHRRRPT